MNFVYCFLNYDLLGKDKMDEFSYNFLPDYSFFSIEQTRKLNPDSRIYLICSKKSLREDQFNRLRKNSILLVEQEDLFVNSEKIHNLISIYCECKAVNSSLFNFNFVSMARLFFVEELMKQCSIENVFHLEYDNFLYVTEEELSNEKFLNEKYVVCRVADNGLCLGVSFFKDYSVLSMNNNRIIAALLNEKTALPNEMRLLASIYFTIPNSGISFFNSIPETSSFLIFDDCSWGQFFGGTNVGHPPGYLDEKNYTGKFILENKSNLKVKRDENGFFFLVFGNRIYKFASLHIHNKKAIKAFAIKKEL